MLNIRLALLAQLFIAPLSHAAHFTFAPADGAPVVKRADGPRTAEGGRSLKLAFSLHGLDTKITKPNFTALAVDGLPLTSDPGMPALPFQAITVDAAASDIRVIPDLGTATEIDVGRVWPAQTEPCRCAGAKPAVFTDHVSAYQAPASGFVIQSLGDFRGQPVSRVLFFPHRYDPKTGKLQVYAKAKFEVRIPNPVKVSTESQYDYLILAPRSLAGALGAWTAWKSNAQGLRFHVAIYEDIGSPASDALKAWIHAEYARAHFRFALLVGGKAEIPQAVVETSTDKATPSDLPYFTMGGADDVIPDVLAGRVVASDAATLQRILGKWMEYERDTTPASGWHREVGIASNQGSNPSDAEYIGAIQAKLKDAFGTDAVYLYQNNADSTPENFNAQLANGAMWVTYIGHGSGTDWPSFGVTYGIPEISALRNASAVKPVWIDVACLNGALEPRAAGATLASATDATGAATGVAAYVGGTVLVSWNPPAIFARGVAFKLADMPAPTLGDAIQAGQRYLTENTSNLLDIQSNQRWYHLQGDPSLRLRLK